MGVVIGLGPRISLSLGLLVTVAAISIGFAVAFTWTSTYISMKAAFLNSQGMPLQALQDVEQHNHRFATPHISQLALSITPRALPPADALKLADLLEKYKASAEIIHVLKFAYHVSRGDKQAAHSVLGKLNHHIAKQIVEAIRHKSILERQLQTIDVEERSEIQQELNRLSSLPECQRRVEMGELAADGYETCAITEFLLDWAPIPIFKFGKAAGTVARGLARREAAAVGKHQLLRIPTVAGVAAKYELRRASLQGQLHKKIESENALTKAFLDLERKIIIEFLKVTIITAN